MSTPQLRPLGIGEILDVGMKIAWRNAGTLARAVLFVVLPVQILSTVVLFSSMPDGIDYDPTLFGSAEAEPGVDISDSELGAFFVGLALYTLLGFLGSLVATGACYRAIVSAYLGEQTGWRESLMYALRRLHSILWITILAGLATLIGAIACIIPGIYLWVCFAVAVPVLLAEGTKGTRALGRSRRLVSGSWWRVFGVVILGIILVFIIEGALAGLAAGITSIGAGSSPLASGAQTIVTGTLTDLATVPLTAAFATILYFDLRVRKEAFDLQLIAERLGVEPPAGYVAPAEQTPEQPPFWPPPPGWQPSQPGPEPTPPASGDWPPAGPSEWPPNAPEEPDEQPPFWPPPPDWKPPSDR